MSAVSSLLLHGPCTQPSGWVPSLARQLRLRWPLTAAAGTSLLCAARQQQGVGEWHLCCLWLRGRCHSPSAACIHLHAPPQPPGAGLCCRQWCAPPKPSHTAAASPPPPNGPPLLLHAGPYTQNSHRWLWGRPERSPPGPGPRCPCWLQPAAAGLLLPLSCPCQNHGCCCCRVVDYFMWAHVRIPPPG
jgi:hypothetical protein